MTERFVHPALFYRGEREYLRATVPFLVDGLDAGHAVAVAVPPANLTLIGDALGDRAPDVRMLDMTKAGRNPGRIISTVLLAFAEAHPDRPVRIIGEPIWAGRSPAEYPACVQHEALINLAFAGRDATILCPYDADALPPVVLADAALTHPTLQGNDGDRISPSYCPEDALSRYNLPLAVADMAVNTFIVTADNLADARGYARARASRLGLSSDRFADVELVVGELAANSIRHGGGRGTVKVWAADGYLHCQVQDTGTVRDVLAGRRPVPPEKTSGRGLLLVHRVADLVRIYAIDGFTTVRAYFSLGAA